MFCRKDLDVWAGIMLVECDHSYEGLLVTFALDLREWIHPELPNGFKPSRKADIKNFKVTNVALTRIVSVISDRKTSIRLSIPYRSNILSWYNGFLHCFFPTYRQMSMCLQETNTKPVLLLSTTSIEFPVVSLPNRSTYYTFFTKSEWFFHAVAFNTELAPFVKSHDSSNLIEDRSTVRIPN